MQKQDKNIYAQRAVEKAAWDAKRKEKSEKNQYVTLIDIDIPFMRVVWFLVQLSIAMIPAGIIIFVVYSLLVGFLFGI